MLWWLLSTTAAPLGLLIIVSTRMPIPLEIVKEITRVLMDGAKFQITIGISGILTQCDNLETRTSYMRVITI